MQTIYTGIDGGGTKTSVTALDGEGRVIFSHVYGPSNFLNGSEFEDTMFLLFRDLFIKIKDIYRSGSEINIRAGFAGISSGECENRLVEIFKKASLGYDVSHGSFSIESDALLALNVYFDKKPGLLLISGTGSICYGKDKEGKIFRTGGFGYLIDDAGSGFWFGKEAVKAALSSHYHPDSKTVLEDMVKKHYGIDNIDEIFSLIYRKDPRSVVSSAAELVFIAAEEGCRIADEIIERGAGELIKLVRDCSKLIGGSSPCVVLHGSVFKQESFVDIIRKDLSSDMNVYISDKRIDLEAACLLLDKAEE